METSPNRCLQELRRLLDESGAAYEVLEHPLAFTAQRVADVEHVPGHAFVKSVIVFIDGRPALLALPAPHEVDLAALASALGARDVRLATEREFGPLFPNCEVGAMPPFPGPSRLPVYLDEALLAPREVVFEAGSHTQSLRMATADYVRVVQPRVLSFAREPAGRAPRSKRS